MGYNVIYADPPWNYKQKSTGRGNKSGATNVYKTMSLADIKNMNVAGLTEEDALCFVWATVPLLNQGFEVLKAWGFTYKTLIV